MVIRLQIEKMNKEIHKKEQLRQKKIGLKQSFEQKVEQRGRFSKVEQRGRFSNVSLIQ